MVKKHQPKIVKNHLVLTTWLKGNIKICSNIRSIAKKHSVVKKPLISNHSLHSFVAF
jgi:hypothetical protein